MCLWVRLTAPRAPGVNILYDCSQSLGGSPGWKITKMLYAQPAFREQTLRHPVTSPVGWNTRLSLVLVRTVPATGLYHDIVDWMIACAPFAGGDTVGLPHEPRMHVVYESLPRVLYVYASSCITFRLHVSVPSGVPKAFLGSCILGTVED